MGLDRRAIVGRIGNLGSFEFPRRETTVVQMVTADLRIRVELLQRVSERVRLGRRTGSKFQLELYLATLHRIATYRTSRPALRQLNVRLGLAVGSRPRRIASRAFARRIGSSGMAFLPEWLCASAHSPCGKPRGTSWNTSRNSV